MEAPAAAAAAGAVAEEIGEHAQRAALISAWFATPGARAADFQCFSVVWPTVRFGAWLAQAVEARGTVPARRGGGVAEGSALMRRPAQGDAACPVSPLPCHAGRLGAPAAACSPDGRLSDGGLGAHPVAWLRRERDAG
ncbi:unnamed protein product [Prorocentrum cordatum]|uniref:Uncharacterized protein n=1 Tax=Prorocentrum cordatum TaxID=2364126 RepID=A0ABN9VJ88_9DINO|nr:unnamed protein product [Polarella glacialis]